MSSADHRGNQQRVRWRLLGRVEVRTPDGWTGVGAPKLRVLLAMLLATPGQVVSTERLIGELWADADPPAGCRKLVSQYVFRLRRLIGDPAGRALVTEPPGYRLVAAAGDVDAGRFGKQLAAAQAAVALRDAGRAAELSAEALGLWRGAALANVPRGPLVAAEAHRLDELRLDALELQAEAGLALGRAARLVAELRALTASHPLRERLWLLLMRALNDSGRPAEALAAYAQARQVIADQLGADPSPELQQLHQRLLTRDPPRAAGPARQDRRSRVAAGSGPRQLPGAVRHFVARASELRELSGLADGAADGGRTTVISAISGTAGVGKTALAIHWAHRVAGDFPDGQLYVNLRGYDPDQPMTAAEALAGFLRALGVPGPDIPAATEERAAEYRSMLAGRRMLVLLDNAGSAEQVRPLLPGAQGCIALVTSRDALAGLVARDGARRLDLDLLPPADAAALLTRLVGDRAAADPSATQALAAQCARLPLALRVAAELAAARPGVPLAELTTELADQQPLKSLDAGGDPRTAVWAVFSWSYRHLEADAADAFRLLGLHPGADFDAYAAAALIGRPVEQAQRLLGRLASAHLIHYCDLSRYSLHDLLRDYARDLSTAQDDEANQRAALIRLFDYYLHTAACAMDSLYPAERHRRPQIATPDAAVPPVTAPAQARTWLDAERANLTAAADYAATQHWPGHAIQLGTTLFRYLDTGGHYVEATAIHTHAHRAARRAGDRKAEAEALVSLAVADWRQGRCQQAAGHLQQTLLLYRQMGNRAGQARALNNLSLVDIQQGRYQQATCHLLQAYNLYRQTSDHAGETSTLVNLGLVERRCGLYQQATSHLQLALDLCRRNGDHTDEASALAGLADVALRQGRDQQANGHLQQAITLCRHTGNRNGEASALVNLGLVDRRRGRYTEATDHLQRALALFRETGDRGGEIEALNGLGELLLATGELSHAHARHTEALRQASQIGDIYEQARADDGLGSVCHALGDPGQGRRHWQQALTLYASLGAPEADRLRDRLAATGSRSLALIPSRELSEQAEQPAGPATPGPGPADRLRHTAARHRARHAGHSGEWGPASPSGLPHVPGTRPSRNALRRALGLLTGGFGWMLVAWIPAYAGSAIVFALYPVLFQHAFGVAPETSSLAFAVIVFVSLPLFLLAGRASQRRGPRAVMAGGLGARVVLLAVLAILAAAGSVPSAAPLAVFGGILFAWSFLSVASPGLTGQLVPQAEGEAQGVLNAASGIAGFLGAVIGGAVASTAGYPAALALGAAATAVGLLVFAVRLLRPGRPRPPATEPPSTAQAA